MNITNYLWLNKKFLEFINLSQNENYLNHGNKSVPLNSFAEYQRKRIKFNEDNIPFNDPRHSNLQTPILPQNGGFLLEQVSSLSTNF